MVSVVTCRFDYTNNAQEDLYLCKHETPFEGFLSPFLSVINSKSRLDLDYKGYIVYRDTPKWNEFILLRAGETVSTTLRITDAFNFDIDGSYIIEYSSPLHYIARRTKEEMASRISLSHLDTQATVPINLQETEDLLKPAHINNEIKIFDKIIDNSTTCNYVNIIGGSYKEQDAVMNIHSKLCNGIRKAIESIANNKMYKKWFGNYTEEYYEEVEEMYETILNGLKQSRVTYVMNHFMCRHVWKAITVPGDEWVLLCPSFFKNKKKSCNYKKPIGSNEGILLHMWSHAFGYSVNYNKNAKQLAKHNEEQAITSADNYEAFYCQTTTKYY